LSDPESVRVSVFDAVFREVAVVHEGPATDKARFSVETASLAPGVYSVRASSGGGVATAGLTVVR
jgi:hypothetical protein